MNTDTPALEALAKALERLGIGPVGLTPELAGRVYSDLTANGFTIAPVAEAEAGRAIEQWLAEPESSVRIDRMTLPEPERYRVWFDRSTGEQHIGFGPTPQAAIAAALQDEATR